MARKVVKGKFPTAISRKKEAAKKARQEAVKELRKKQQVYLFTDKQVQYCNGVVVSDYLHCNKQPIYAPKYVCPRCGVVVKDNTYRLMSGEYVCHACGKCYFHPIIRTIEHRPPEDRPRDNLPIENPDWIK